MKMKIINLAFATILILSSAAYAQEPDKSSSQEENFAEHKAQMVKDLNEEKTAIDQVISCVNSTQKKEDMKKCYDIKKANMEKIRERNRAQRKERLQNELKKLDEEGKNSKN